MATPVMPGLLKGLAAGLETVLASGGHHLYGDDTRQWMEAARGAQQVPEGDWSTWLLLGGRGSGKTRTGAETMVSWLKSRVYRRPAFIGQTAADVRDVMIEGESGLLAACYREGIVVRYEPSKRRVSFPEFACHGTAYSAEKPRQLRGPQHDCLWADEIRSWQNGRETWDNAMLGLRLGPQPRALATSTPLPLKWIKRLIADPLTHVTKMSTWDNLANLSPLFRENILRRYEGTRLARQELDGEMLDDVENALWTSALIEQCRVAKVPMLNGGPDLVRVAVAIDPAVTSGPESSETGIVGGGLGADGHGYLMRDTTCRLRPDGWARRALETLDDLDGDLIIGEVNNGGDMIETTIRTIRPKVNYKAIRASRGKHVRAEPVAALYEQGRVHHVGEFPQLEDQMLLTTNQGYQGDTSPDRMDAAVWLLTELMLGPQPKKGTATWGRG